MQEEQLVYLPGYEILSMIQKKEVSCREVTETFLNRIERLNPKVHAYILVLKKLALVQADQVDRGEVCLKDNPLAGLPISIKDLLFDIEERVTTNGSLACKALIAANDSLAVQRLRRAGAIFLGKTNVPEFGSEFMTHNKLMPPTANPWDLKRSAGGSSGGAAASVSAGLATVALANDSAGSIRLPSGLCSLFGYMPSYGCVPIVTKEETTFKPLHRIGPISHTVKDAALMLNTLNQPTALDPDQQMPIDFVKLLEKDPKKLKIAWSPDLGFGIQKKETIQIIENRLKELEGLGFKVDKLEMPIDLKSHVEDLTNYIVARFTFLAEQIPLLAKPLLGSSILAMMRKSIKISNKDFLKATAFKETFREKMKQLMQSYDLIITPTSAEPSFPIRNWRQEVKKVYADPFIYFAFLLYPFNVTGQPAASVPCGFTCENLPIGMQIIGPENNDSDIFQFCGFYERAFPWKDFRPQIETV